ncbi:MAG TPA: preprotein translocase subunit YajC [Acidimicrobiales bacterium]|nr:preprotein translocase subunit YajC [Acidimicrobiales bacterium]
MLSVLLASTTTTTKGSGSSSSNLIFLVLLVAFVALYFLVLRPRSRRARQQASGNATLAVGDEVVSAGGILGTVVAIAGDEIVVEVSPGTTLTFWRRAVNLRTAVPGAPASSSRPAVPGEETYDDVYEDETYDDESYDDEAGAGEAADDGYGSVPPAGEGAGNGTAGRDEDAATEVSEADHRDTSGGPGEGR